MINMDNGKTLGLSGDDQVKYADVTSGGEAITMLLSLSGGPYARIEVPFLIFKNKDGIYPIRNVCSAMDIKTS